MDHALLQLNLFSHAALTFDGLNHCGRIASFRRLLTIDLQLVPIDSRRNGRSNVLGTAPHLFGVANLSLLKLILGMSEGDYALLSRLTRLYG